MDQFEIGGLAFVVHGEEEWIYRSCKRVDRRKIRRGGFMLSIAGVMITFVRTRPPPQSTFRSDFALGWCRNMQVAGGVGQVCTQVDCRFGLVA